SFFSIVAALSFYGLCRRTSDHPFLLTLLFLSSPALFVFIPTLMMDVPMLALLLAGLHWYLKGSDGSVAWLLAAAISFTVAVAFAYAALVPLACLVAAALWKRRPARELAVTVAPFAVLVLWAIALTLHYGELPLIKTAQHFARVGSIASN